MVEKLKALIATVELTEHKVGLETLKEILPTAEKLEKLEDIVAEEMAKDDDESDLLIIGEKVVSHLGYWG
jgi:F420-0:gamma-glutamyl ligase